MIRTLVARWQPDARPPASGSWQRRHTWMLLALLAVIALFYLITLRDGHRAGDFAVFVNHAANIVEGRPYTETTYVMNPQSHFIGGLSSYPPGTPLLLAPIYAVFGLNLTAMQVWMVVIFIASLFLLALLFRDELPPAYLLVAVGLVGFQPFFWDIKEDVLSDLPFLLFVLLSLLSVKALVRASEDGRTPWVLAVGTGLLFFMATITRSVGLALPISLFLFDALRSRRVFATRVFWIPAVVFVVLMVLENVLVPIDSGSDYAVAFRQGVDGPLDVLVNTAINAKNYAVGCIVNILYANGYSSLLRYALAGVSFLLVLAGFLWQAWRRFSMTEVFTVVFTGVMIVWPFQIPRYLIPIYALFFFYLMVGLYHTQLRLPHRIQPVVLAVFAGLMALTYGLNYTGQDFETLDQDVASANAYALYDYVQAHVPENALVICRVPATLALFTGRLTTPPLEPDNDREHFNQEEAAALFDHLRDMGITHAVTGPKGKRFHPEVLPLWHLAHDYPDRFERLYGNEAFELYRVRDPEENPKDASETSTDAGTPQ